MSVFTQEENARLRLIGIGGPVELNSFLDNGERIVIRRFEGVYVLDPADPKLAVPEGATVIARVNRPVELQEVQDQAGFPAVPSPASQPYVWERAPRKLATPFTVGGVAFDRTRQRVLNVVNGANIEATQVEPAWADFLTPQTGDLVQSGKALNLLPTRGQTGDTPELPAAQRDIIRWRWTGTAVAAAVLVTAAAGEGPFESPGGPTYGWPSGHRNLVPGSIVITLNVGGTLRDDGKGRLVGEGGDGVVDYLTGAFQFSTPGNVQGGNITVDYEHECTYFPLDAVLQWDALMASN